MNKNKSNIHNFNTSLLHLFFAFLLINKHLPYVLASIINGVTMNPFNIVQTYCYSLHYSPKYWRLKDGPQHQFYF
jgi:hypothetical protein